MIKTAGASVMKSALLALASGCYAVMVLAGCSVAMALNGTPEPNFKAFEIGSSRQIVEIQLGKPVASQPLGDGKKKDTYRFEMGNSPNGHRALMNLYIDLATIGLWEIPGTIVEARMGRQEETRITYDANDRVLAIEGYAPPEPTGALKEAIEAHEKFDQPAPAPNSAVSR
ncbi:MAG: hypothetical protein EPO02_01490 [Nitrospirae bacterium]|nr:MAG: hypothetical protein EPO02_01490 [Nitrospirota bacterium]